MTDKNSEILITGHLNPDTDSICAAIAYADLKSRTEEGSFVACRAGDISNETRWVLERFGLEAPRLIEDVSPQLCDMEIRKVRGIKGELTVRQVWEIMHNNDISTLPIVDGDKHLLGLISVKDLAFAFMDSFNSHALTVSDTSFSDIARTLKGEVVCGDPEGVLKEGRIAIGAGDIETIRENVRPGDLVITANREDAQRAAIEAGAKCLVVTTFAEISEDIFDLARRKGSVLISTAYDTYKASYYINQSVPVRHYMATDGFTTFTLRTPVEDVMSVMGKSRHVYFPVLDDGGRFYGLVSKRNMLNRGRKELILVDHNERSQCVPGWEEADILEIVDHHRVGGIQTINPIFVRNQPLGSTCTIITQMYREAGLDIPADIAGAMLCAILSDTLMFMSPTCTDVDRKYAEELAAIAGVEIRQTGEAMFAAGEDLSRKTGDDLLHGDYKIFNAFGSRIGVSQSMFLSPQAIEKAIDLTDGRLDDLQRSDGTDFAYYILTDISKKSSIIRCADDASEKLLREAFGLEPGEELLLRGVVSRKKQFVPAVIEALRLRAEDV
ncbi:MAG: putative manganese-dependent inorganic diphosphatase [Firmicutes bacterium]|nr:putative manganese-dependent inorganic diphosphatase [Bacillota bacterium]